MIAEQSKQIIAEIEKAFIGKREIVEKVLMTIYAGCHVLLEGCPGVGKTKLHRYGERFLREIGAFCLEYGYGGTVEEA